jgi:hypothetical protein
MRLVISSWVLPWMPGLGGPTSSARSSVLDPYDTHAEYFIIQYTEHAADISIEAYLGLYSVYSKNASHFECFYYGDLITCTKNEITLLRTLISLLTSLLLVDRQSAYSSHSAGMCTSHRGQRCRLLPLLGCSRRSSGLTTSPAARSFNA